MKLASNRELYEYLLILSSILRIHGCEELVRGVTDASQFAAGASTEFLGESRIVLRRVAEEVAGILSKEDLADLIEVLGQLDAALDRRGVGTKTSKGLP
jgi:hypothetical protein